MKIVCIPTNRPYLADEASYMPLSAHGLHRPVGDGLLTTLAFGKDHVCVAFLTISLTLVFVVTNIVGGEIQVATTTTKTSGMPRPIQGSYTILKYISNYNSVFAQCSKITEKFSFKIANKASYVYI